MSRTKPFTVQPGSLSWQLIAAAKAARVARDAQPRARLAWEADTANEALGEAYADAAQLAAELEKAAKDQLARHIRGGT